MRVRYTYQSFPDSPMATELSKQNGRSGATTSMLDGAFVLTAICCVGMAFANPDECIPLLLVPILLFDFLTWHFIICASKSEIGVNDAYATYNGTQDPIQTYKVLKAKNIFILVEAKKKRKLWFWILTMSYLTIVLIPFVIMNGIPELFIAPAASLIVAILLIVTRKSIVSDEKIEDKAGKILAKKLKKEEKRLAKVKYPADFNRNEELTEGYICVNCGQRKQGFYQSCPVCDSKMVHFTEAQLPALQKYFVKPRTRVAEPVMTNGTIYCRRCGNKMPSDSLFCPACGERVIT